MRLRSLRVRHAKERIFQGAFLAGIAVALGSLAFFLADILAEAWPALRPEILVSFPSFQDPTRAGIAPAIVGSLWLVGMTLLFSLPLGVAAGIYLEEYARRSRLARLLQAGVANLAGVPSVVFGLLGLMLFVRGLDLGPVVLAGALTLTMLVFPYVVITTQEAIRAVPASLRDGSLALGATHWQTVRRQVIPAAAPGLLTAAILAASRAMGETAPLIVIGAVVFMKFLPYGPDSPFIALPVQIYAWTGLPQDEWRSLAAAAIVVFLGILLSVNLGAILLRGKLQRRW